MYIPEKIRNHPSFFEVLEVPTNTNEALTHGGDDHSDWLINL